MKKKLSFIIPYFVFVSVAVLFLFIYSKAEIHIAINQHHNNFFDIFFKVATRLGNGLAIPVVAVVLLFFSYRKAFSFAGAGIFSGIFVQSLKRLIFSDTPRPRKFFEQIYQNYELYIIPGTDPASSFSFPSGHAASAFALFFGLAFICKNNLVKFGLFIPAMLTAFSRVYLSWHFLEDIVAGSVIGIISVLLSFYIFDKSKVKWLDKSLRITKIQSKKME